MSDLIKQKMRSPVNSTVKGVPRLLTTQFDAYWKDVTEKAVAHYIRDNDLTPKQFAGKQFKIKLLLPYLQQYDRQWYDVPMDQMKTTPPRTLVQYMNTHVNRWAKQFEAVQKVIDTLPESRDLTAEMQADDKKSKTLSEDLSQ